MKLGYLFVLAVCLFLITGCGDDNNNGTGGNVQPTISSFSPNQVNRGQQNVTGRIQGTNLGGVVSVALGDGLTVVRFSGVSANEIEVVFSVGNNAAAGARTITITTSAGTASSSSVLSVSDNRIPLAKFTVSPTKGAENTEFTVDATNSDDPDGKLDKYQWDFGDNKTATGRVAMHKYSEKGTYKITLTVTDNKGATASTNHDVEVEKGQAPVAFFLINPPSGDTGTTFTFDASASTDDGNVVSFEWRFGDGQTGTGKIVKHTFRGGGVFDVTLTVTDNTGLQNVRERHVRVENFNEEKAEAEIAKLMQRFFDRFGKLTRFDAETIVDGWSTSPECKGRDHEIAIIEQQQAIIAETSADVTDMDILVKPTKVDANADVTARFEWTEKDGTEGKSTVLHKFTLIFEDGEWQICNFQIEVLSGGGAQKLFLLD